MLWIAFALLLGALMVFLLSTAQFGLRARFAIWITGAALLFAAVFAAKGWRENSLFPRLAGDVLHGDFSWLVRLSQEWHTVSEAATPLFGLSWLFAAALGVLALVAFTPGKAIEHGIRPLKFGLIGAIVGSFVALSAVAIGLAGYYKHSIYSAKGSQIAVLDGDTLIFGDVPIRLIGVDAPELDQMCSTPLVELGTIPCGKEAKARLQILVGINIVVCENRFPEPDGKPPRESFGRPLLQCFVKRRGLADVDIGLSMISSGYAFAFKSAKVSHYEAAAQKAREDSVGLFALSCVETPSEYRDGVSPKSAFGKCSSTPKPPSPPRAP